MQLLEEYMKEAQ